MHQLAEALVLIHRHAEPPRLFQGGEAVGDAPEAPGRVDGLLPIADAAGSEHGEDWFYRLFLGRRKLSVVGIGEPVGAYGSLVKPRPLLDERSESLREREEPILPRFAGGGTRQAPS